MANEPIPLNTAFVFRKQKDPKKKFTLTVDEIKESYKEWLKKKSKSDLIYYGNMTVNAFIMGEDGLGSVTEDKNIPVIQDFLINIRKDHIKTLRDGA